MNLSERGKVKKPGKIFLEKKVQIIGFISDGNSEIGAHGISDIYLRHLFSSRKVTNLDFSP